MHIRIEKAQPKDAELLSRLAMLSKAYWGYSAEFLDQCREELTYDGQYIDNNSVYMALYGTTIVGFYSLENVSVTSVELGAMFVSPSYIGQGIGTALIEHAKSHARWLGYKIMIIQGDPNAEKFYLSAGARHAGEKESDSITGRLLPMYTINLIGDDIV